MLVTSIQLKKGDTVGIIINGQAIPVASGGALHIGNPCYLDIICRPPTGSRGTGEDFSGALEQLRSTLSQAGARGE